MSTWRLMLDQLRGRAEAVLAQPGSAVFTFAFPIFFLVVLGSLEPGQRIGSLGNVPFDQFFTPNIVAFGLMSSCFVNIGINLAFRRDTGLLKRVRGRRCPRRCSWAAIILNAFLVSAITTVIVMAIGIGFYDVKFASSNISPAGGRVARRRGVVHGAWESPWRPSSRTPTPAPRWSTRCTSRSRSCQARSSRSAPPPRRRASRTSSRCATSYGHLRGVRPLRQRRQAEAEPTSPSWRSGAFSARSWRSVTSTGSRRTTLANQRPWRRTRTATSTGTSAP